MQPIWQVMDMVARSGDSAYVPADVHDHYGAFSGLHLVLEQNFEGLEDPKEWNLHQDLALTLGLRRERGIWVRPVEGYETVAREVRVNERPVRIDIRSGHLKDYLCARKLGLIALTYRSRSAVLHSRDGITWPDGSLEETGNGDRWVGGVSEIHEGGRPYGVETAVFHAARTDVDDGEDVPVMGSPSDNNIASSSWTLRDHGRKLYRVSGELWRTEWIPPSSTSPIIRKDGPPPDESFIVDADGTEERGPALAAARRWLWFKPELATAVAHRRGGHLEWYTRDTGAIGCSGFNVHFGVNDIGLLNAFAKDVVEQPAWLQRIWSGHNVRPEGGVSQELLASQVKAAPAETLAPEAFLEASLQRFEAATQRALASGILRSHEKVGDLLTAAHRFRAVSEEGLLALAKDLCRLIVDRVDARVLQTIAKPPKGAKWGSLKSLEMVLALKIDPAVARRMLTPLVGLYELRLGDAHLPSAKHAEAFKMASIDPNSPFVMQGHDLLYSCVSCLYRISDAIDERR